jgi:hypothetical protein
LIGAILTMGVVGYSAGLTTRGSLLTAVMLVVALGVVLTVVIDLDRPSEGFVRVNQQPLIDLLEDLGVTPNVGIITEGLYRNLYFSTRTSVSRTGSMP